VGSSDLDKSDAISSEEVENAAGDVVFTGWREDVADVIAAMDVFVLPSWREGVPRSAIEAAALGKPLVLTDIRGCREVARNDVEGILVPPGDPDVLAQAIARLVADGSLRTQMGRAARKRAEGRFDERDVCNQVVQESERLLSSKVGRVVDDRHLQVRPARLDDASILARLHRESMPDAFLPSLGSGFMTCLYKALVTDKDAVTLVAENGAGVVGFAAGGVSVRGFYRRFYRRHGLAATVRAVPSLVRPSVLRRALETARYPGDGGELPVSELLSIAVDSSYRSSGVGSRLAGAFLDKMATKGVDELKVVVGADNQGANAFYERVGFSFDRTIAVHDGVASNVWVIRCRS
jgi:ribosomal protein S18 acetylase RimI-like enzyme